MKLQKNMKKIQNKISENQNWRRAIEIAKGEKEKHPKIKAVIRIIQQIVGDGKKALVFYGNKETASEVNGVLNIHGIRSDKIFGGRDKNVKITN